MKHETTGKRMERYLRNRPVRALKGARKGFDWSKVDTPRGRALIGFSVAMLWLVIIILMSEQI